jgi:hypothetical protein
VWRYVPEGRGADVSLADTGALFGCAKRALDAAAGPRGGGAGQVFLITASGWKEPGGVAVGFPGGAQQVEGGLGQGDIALLGPLTPVHMEHVARAIDIAHVQGERFVEAQSTAREGGAVDAMVQRASWP